MAKNYIKGSIRRKSFGEGEPLLIASLLLSDLEKIANEKGYVNIVISARKDVDAFGNSHYAYENEFKPTKEAGESAATQVNRPAAKLSAPDYKEKKEYKNPFE